MENQLKFVEALLHNLSQNFKTYLKNEKENRWKNIGNKDHGKTALKRKITLIRQELLNLEKMLDD